METHPTNSATRPIAKRTSVIATRDDSPEHIETMLAAYADDVEYLKVTSDEAEQRTDVDRIVAICNAHDVRPIVGGGMTEIALRRNSLPEFLGKLQTLKIGDVEFSNSTDISLDRLDKLIAETRKDFRVLVEIGSKSETGIPHKRWLESLHHAVASKPERIIFEGTATGDRGIYTADGKSKTLLVLELLEAAGELEDRCIIEAPSPHQQAYWLTSVLGAHVRLGNVHLEKNHLKGIHEERNRLAQRHFRRQFERTREQQKILIRKFMHSCARKGINPLSVYGHPSCTEKDMAVPTAFKISRDTVDTLVDAIGFKTPTLPLVPDQVMDDVDIQWD